MRTRTPGLDEAPEHAPAPMDAGAAYRLARRLWGRFGGVMRAGSAAVVGRRIGGPESRRMVPCGHGPTWEAAFDNALRMERR